MRNLFDPNLRNKQFQVGQENVSHINYGPCDIVSLEVYDGIIYYQVLVKNNGLKLKCAGSKLTCEVRS